MASLRIEAIVDPITGGTRVVVAEETRLFHTLDVLARSIGGTRTAVIADRSGFPVATLDRTADTLGSAAMATLVLDAARNVCANLDLPGLHDVTIEGRGWKVFVHALGPRFTLFIVSDGDVEPMFVKREFDRHEAELLELLMRMA